MDAPQRPLSPRAMWVWRVQQLGVWGALCVGGVIAALNLDALGPLPWIVPLIGLLTGTALIPRLRWSRWRWDVRDEGIDIQHGTITVRRTLVPWVRVQHVDTRRGVFEQSFGLSTVVVHTAAGGHTIPLLPEREAEALRERIAGLARSDDGEPAATADPLRGDA
jgi:membrane protein YdbS with pleckstrin-like domain